MVIPIPARRASQDSPTPTKLRHCKFLERFILQG